MNLAAPTARSRSTTSPAAWQLGIPTTGPGNDHPVKLAARLHYTPPAGQLDR